MADDVVTMYPTPTHFKQGTHGAFTLVELLTVIAIIGVLAAMLLAVLQGGINAAKKAKARLEEAGLVLAIEQYDSAYGRFPISAGIQTAAAGGDFTFGGALLAKYAARIGGTPNYTTNNSEVIAILMDLTSYPDGAGVTANNGHLKNPQRTAFLNAKMAGTTNSPGVGPDLIYRDPWGNPYVITLDLNDDGGCRDAFYGLDSVSGLNQTSGNPGLNGLTNPDLTKNNNFQFHGRVMVWSAGSDGKIDPQDSAKDWENRNNVLSWK